MASEIRTTDDVKSDFSPGSVEGVSVPPIPKRLGVSDTRKYCKRSGNPFSVDNTNDMGMLQGTNAVKITRSGYYCVSFCTDFNTSNLTKEHRLNVNGSVIRQVGAETQGSRTYVPGSAFVYLNSGDVLTISATSGSVNNTTATFLEVLEIS